MAEELWMALVDVLRKAGVEQADFLREGVRVLAQALMGLEVAEQRGAERHERTPERAGYRNRCWQQLKKCAARPTHT